MPCLRELLEICKDTNFMLLLEMNKPTNQPWGISCGWSRDWRKKRWECAMSDISGHVSDELLDWKASLISKIYTMTGFWAIDFPTGPNVIVLS